MCPATKKPDIDDDAEVRLEAFVAKFDAKDQALIRAVRKAMRGRFPTCHELVYDNYNFFVIGYCTSERPSDCICSLASNRNGVGLAFYYGATLPDPHKILQGSGNQNRFVRLPDGAKTLAQPEVQALITAAIAQAKTPLPKQGKGKLIIRSISEKQKARK